MAQDLNTVTLTGRVVSDATVRQFQNGGAIMNFTIAVNKSVKGQDGQWNDKTSFFDTSYSSNGVVNLANYVKKGTLIAVAGELEQQTWEKDGKKNSKVIVKILNIKLLGGNNNGQQSAPQQYPQQYQQSPQQYQQQVPQVQGVSNGVPPNYQQPQQYQNQNGFNQWQQQMSQASAVDLNNFPDEIPF